MLPFTHDQFFFVYAVYNLDVWPVALAAFSVALTILLGGWPRRWADRRAGALALALMWVWVGIVFHGLYFSRINPLAPLFGLAFLLQGLIFAAVVTLPGDHGLQEVPRHSQLGRVMMAYTLIVYPMVGLAAGQRLPAMPLFGVTPSSLVMFTFAQFLCTNSRGWWLWVIPLLWTVIGTSAALSMRVPQDLALPVFALAALWLTVERPDLLRDGSGHT